MVNLHEKGCLLHMFDCNLCGLFTFSEGQYHLPVSTKKMFTSLFITLAFTVIRQKQQKWLAAQPPQNLLKFCGMIFDIFDI